MYLEGISLINVTEIPSDNEISFWIEAGREAEFSSDL